MTTPSLTIGRPSAIGSLLERLAWRVALSGAGDPVRASDGRPAGWNAPGVRRRGRRREDQAQIEIHDREALVRLLVGGETGGGEAYMDGFWSSPDLAALLRLAARNRESLSLSAGWFRVLADPSHARPPDAAQHARRGAPEHRGPLRPGQRLLPAVPRRDADRLLRSLRDARPDACYAQRNKYRQIAAGAGLSAGQHVLEVGSRWGGFALYAARSSAAA